MPIYRQVGQVPRKHHIRASRNPGTSFRGEGLAYEHVVTTAGFDRAYSITYHLRPPTRVKKIESAGHLAPTAVEGQPLSHRHIRSQELARTGDPILGRVPILFNEDVI